MGAGSLPRPVRPQLLGVVQPGDDAVCGLKDNLHHGCDDKDVRHVNRSRRWLPPGPHVSAAPDTWG